MTPFEQFFDGRLFCINLARRGDRWANCERQFRQFGFTAIQRFEACADMIDESGRVNGNLGCTTSHRKLLDLQIANAWPFMFVLEDDFSIIYHDFHERWDRFAAELPATWDMCYLGAGYGEPPIARVSQHVIRAGRLLTTSSYGITLAMARKMAPSITGVGPIDSLYGGFHRDNEVYIISPRCVVQFPNYSDLQERDSGNAQSMLTRDLEAGL